MEKGIKRRFNIFTAYAIISSLAIILLAVYILTISKNAGNIDELTVKRINVVDEDGTLRMVLSNRSCQHPGRIDGQDFPERERQAGIIFFNSVGDECGGLVFEGNDEEAALVLSVDKYKDDQVMQLQYIEDTRSKRRKYGLQLWDYTVEDGFRERMRRWEEMESMGSQEEKMAVVRKMKEQGLLAEERLFVGRSFNKEVGLFISDDKGLPRIKLYVGEEGEPRLEFLDEYGEVMER